MSIHALGLGLPARRRSLDEPTVLVMPQRPLRRLLAFSRHTIDEVVNSRAAKNELFGYYKLYKQIGRQSEVRDLERQWNPVGM